MLRFFGRRAWLILAILALGLLLRLAFLVVYFDHDWEPDGYQHVLMSKSVYADPLSSLWYLILVWAKPLYTFFFATLYQFVPSSWPALVVTQVTNTFLWFAAGLLTLRIARDLFARDGTLVVLAGIVAFSFVSFRASITANTEPFGALMFAFALFCWHRDRIVLSLFALGAVLLIRTDAIFFVSVFAAAVLIDTLKNRNPGWVAEFLIRGVAFALPLLLWNVAGYIHTGSLFYVLTHGYPAKTGLYGFGTPLHFVIEFFKFDTVFFALFWIGVVIALTRWRSTPKLLAVSAVACIFYFIVMSVMFFFGAFANGGLLRYFVFGYPAYILVAGLAADSFLGWLEDRRRPAALKGALIAGLILVLVGQLHWLVRAPQWSHSLLTRVPINPMQRVTKLPLPLDKLDVYADSPEVLYYLGKSSLYSAQHPLSVARDPSVHGIFVFNKGWSETYSRIDESVFAGEKPVAVIPTIATVVYIYVR